MRAKSLELIFGHHRFLAELSLGDFILGKNLLGIGRKNGDRLVIFRFDDPRDHSSVIGQNDGRLILFGHHSTRIDDIAEKVIEIRSIASVKSGPTLPPVPNS